MNKNAATLKDFTIYCTKNPHLRFWQALKGWADRGNIYVGDIDIASGTVLQGLVDTYYVEGK